MNRLNGKVAIITGGSSGIGLATAKLFLEEGAKVAVVSRNAKRAEGTLSAVPSADKKVIYVNADICSEEKCKHVVAETVAAFGKVDILFNGAGVIYVDKNVIDTTEEIWDETMDVNLKGSFLMSKHVVPEMLKVGSGSIVNTSSIFGMAGAAGVVAYCVAKGGVIQLTKAMAVDHAAQNIRVNCICPGSVETPMLRKEMSELGDIDEMRKLFASRHPMNRISQPEESAYAVLFLASDEASFVTGVALPVDGGRSAW